TILNVTLAQSSFWDALGDAVRHEPVRGAGLGMAVGLVVLLLLLLPQHERRLVRGPVLLLCAHLAFILLYESAAAEPFLQHAGLFCLLAAIGRGLFLLAFHSRLSGLLFPTLPK